MGRTKARKKPKSKPSPGPQRRVVTVQELEAALGRIRKVVPENEFQTIENDFGQAEVVAVRHHREDVQRLPGSHRRVHP